MDGPEPLADEFDVMAAWSADAALDLGAAHLLPTACRTSPGPAALAWLGEACELAAGSVLLDVGGGTGGPAAWAALRFGVRPVSVEPMAGACRAAVRTFAMATVRGSGERLPLAAEAFDAAWCIGVLCTTPAKAELLGELRRVLRAGSALGLFVLVADQPSPVGAPRGNLFPSAGDVEKLLDLARFDPVEQRPSADFGAPPRSWADRVEQVDQAVDGAHRGDPRLASAHEQSDRLNRLMADGTVRGLLVHARAR